MVGSLDKSIFDPDSNYETFYSGHKFEPFHEEMSIRADELVPRVAWALDVATETKARNVLDLCCLDGFASLTLAHKLGMKADGVDLSEPGIKIANNRAAKYNLDACYEQLPVEQLDYHEPYDLVILFEAIEHFTDVDEVIRVIKRHMAFDGTFLVSTPDAEGIYGIGNNDACHLQIYSHRPSDDLPTNTHDNTKDKPVISLPDYLTEQGFVVTETEVWNGLVHCRARLRP